MLFLKTKMATRLSSRRNSSCHTNGSACFAHTTPAKRRHEDVTMPSRPKEPLWTCPSCGARFVTRNMWHSCGEFTPDRRHRRNRESNGAASHLRLRTQQSASLSRTSLLPRNRARDRNPRGRDVLTARHVPRESPAALHEAPRRRLLPRARRPITAVRIARLTRGRWPIALSRAYRCEGPLSNGASRMSVHGMIEKSTCKGRMSGTQPISVAYSCSAHVGFRRDRAVWWSRAPPAASERTGPSRNLAC